MNDLDPGPTSNEVITPAATAGYQLVDVDGFFYFAGENAVYKIHPDTLAVSSTNSFQNLNYLNLLYDGILIAADLSANLYIFETSTLTPLINRLSPLIPA